jgi:hypothetical protein
VLYQSLSYRFQVRSNEPELARRASELIGQFARPLDGGSPSVVYSIHSNGQYTLHRDGQEVSAGEDAAAMISHLLWLISNDTVELADGYLLIHAGAVVTPGGEGILILGESGSGKTTLVAALVQESLPPVWCIRGRARWVFGPKARLSPASRRCWRLRATASGTSRLKKFAPARSASRAEWDTSSTIVTEPGRRLEWNSCRVGSHWCGWVAPHPACGARATAASRYSPT